MAQLVNRKAPSRLDCLYPLLQHLNDEFGTSSFTLGAAKFDHKSSNIHQTCPHLLLDKNLNKRYCRYLESPLSRSGCQLINSQDYDSTKSKEVGNTFNSLHGLGLVTRTGRTVTISQEGRDFISDPYESPETLKRIRAAILRYGPMVGFLEKIRQFEGAAISTGDVILEYPDSGGVVEIDGSSVSISVGDAKDSNVRRRSTLIAWGITAGFLQPGKEFDVTLGKMSHVNYREMLLEPKRQERFIIANPSLGRDLSGIGVVERPLDYLSLIKDVKALRERGQALSRESTISLGTLVRNRRFAIGYILNHIAKKKETITVSRLVDLLGKNPELYTWDNKPLRNMILAELPICFAIGMAYEVQGETLRPLHEVSMAEFSRDVPFDLLTALATYDI